MQTIIQQLKYNNYMSFTDSTHNPFELTQKSQKQTLDYENNLCYCYDCDQKFKVVSSAHHLETKDSKDPFVETKEISFSNGTLVSQKYRFFKVKIYIGLIVPKNLGGKTVQYELCYDRYNCTLGETAFFGTITQPEKYKISYDKENFVIHEILISRNSRSIYDAVQWTNIHLSGVKI